MGVPESRLRKWLLSIAAVMRSQNGSLVHALALWQQNCAREFAGVEVHSIPSLSAMTGFQGLGSTIFACELGGVEVFRQIFMFMSLTELSGGWRDIFSMVVSAYIHVLSLTELSGGWRDVFSMVESYEELSG